MSAEVEMEHADRNFVREALSARQLSPADSVRIARLGDAAFDYIENLLRGGMLSRPEQTLAVRLLSLLTRRSCFERKAVLDLDENLPAARPSLRAKVAELLQVAVTRRVDDETSEWVRVLSARKLDRLRDSTLPRMVVLLFDAVHRDLPIEVPMEAIRELVEDVLFGPRDLWAALLQDSVTEREVATSLAERTYELALAWANLEWSANLSWEREVAAIEVLLRAARS